LETTDRPRKKDRVSNKERKEAKLLEIDPGDFDINEILTRIKDEDVKIDEKGRYICQLSDFLVGALRLPVITKTLPKRVVTNFHIEFTRDCTIRQGHVSRGAPFADKQHNRALQVDGIVLRGSKHELKESLHDFTALYKSIGVTRYKK
jgi:hypothetical protein